MLLAVDKPIPADHYVANRVVLKPLDLANMKAAMGIIEDVTSLDSPGPWREKRCIGIQATFAGAPDEFMSPEIYSARAMGGGEYFVCLPNHAHTSPRTEADTERIEDEMFSWNYD